MRVIKDLENINDSDKLIALRVMNRLKAGDRVFGNPAEGLKITLKKMEDSHNEDENNKDVLDFLSNDDEYKSNLNKLKAGIKGEEVLAEYFEKIVKHDDTLQDIVLFASLSDPEQSDDSQVYISDSDFVAIYGNNILILDAKNIRTNVELPIYLDGNDLVTVGGNPLLELHSSIFVWKKIFKNNKTPYISIHGVTVIVNNTGACIWKNQDWHKSDVKPIHISELVEFLHTWVNKKSSETNLSLLTTLVKMQIRKEENSLDLRNARKRFNI